MSSQSDTPDHIFDGGDMDCGSGLILLIRQNMLHVPEGGVLELRSSEPTVMVELPPWCRMVGHQHLQSIEDTPGRWRHFIRRGAAQAAEAGALADDLAKARSYEWRLRARVTGGQEATIYARNFSWKIGQPASFEEKDAHPSAIEAALGALAADLANGFATLCKQRELLIDELEANAKARLRSVTAHLGLEEGDPSLASVDVTVFVTSPSGGSELRAAWDDAKKRSPLLQTFSKAAQVETRLAIL